MYRVVGLRLDRVRRRKAGGIVSRGAMFRLVSDREGGKSASASGLGGDRRRNHGAGHWSASRDLHAGGGPDPVRADGLVCSDGRYVEDCFAREGRLGRIAACSDVDGGSGSATGQRLKGKLSLATDWAGGSAAEDEAGVRWLKGDS